MMDATLIVNSYINNLSHLVLLQLLSQVNDVGDSRETGDG